MLGGTRSSQNRKYRTPNIEHRISNTEHRNKGGGKEISNTEHRISNTEIKGALPLAFVLAWPRATHHFEIRCSVFDTRCFFRTAKRNAPLQISVFDIRCSLVRLYRYNVTAPCLSTTVPSGKDNNNVQTYTPGNASLPFILPSQPPSWSLGKKLRFSYTLEPQRSNI